ncbi:MAG: TAXI family TRAP transporter solute-binding subunit, partial [Hyphomicrobiaceae bacterium]
MAVKTGDTRVNYRELSISRILLFVLPFLLLLGGALWYGLSVIQPPPQREVVISTGGEAGGYHAFGKRYQAHLAKEGVKVRLVTSAGAIENLARLKDPQSKVTAALMQGGIGAGQDNAGLLSVGRIFYEPVWVFYRSTETWQRLAQLRGAKIAVGGEGSGTRALTTELLRLSRVGEDVATYLPLGGQAAVDALYDGRVDVAMLTFAPEAPVLQKLVRDPS